MKCYIDDFNQIKIYSDEALSDEKIAKFHLFQEQKEIPLTLVDVNAKKDYFKYELKTGFKIDILKTQQLFYQDQEVPISYRHIVSKKEFDLQYSYAGDDLGSSYRPEGTLFKLWSPTAKQVFLKLNNRQLELEMEKEGTIFSLWVEGDLELEPYCYRVVHQNQELISIDPYSFATTTNAEYSVVLNQEKFIQEKIQPRYPMQSYVDASIYEISIRDLTAHDSSGIENKRKFEGLLETESHFFGYPTAYNYIKQLGITHVQIMPVFDFESYDERNYPQEYNWGYDPLQYSTIEGSYLQEDNPYNRVNVMRKLVNQFHKDDIRVNLDVVFNHVYRTESFAFERLVPHYFFRYQQDDEFSNGSFCGNEIRSESIMMRKYILDMCKRYVDLFDIDGLRFDLMGLVDNETMNQLYQEMYSKKSDFMIYGEGWDMPTVLPFEKRTINYHNYQTPNIAYFNNVYRDIIKGGTMHDALKDVGYALGDLNKLESSFDLILGSTLSGTFQSHTQSINYLACHDNMTFCDKMHSCLYDDDYTKKQKAKLALAVLILSQGVPFIHCGQEFLRTKNGIDNTYNLPDEINAVNWYLSIKNQDVVTTCRKLLKLRRNHPEFRLKTKQEIEKINIYRHYDMIVMEIGDIIVFFNSSATTIKYNFEQQVEVLYCEYLLENSFASELSIQPHSAIVVKNKIV